MGKKLYLILCITYSIQSIEQQLALQSITPENAHIFLRTGTPTETFSSSDDDLDLTLQPTCDFADNLLISLRKLDTITTLSERTLKDPLLNPHSSEVKERGKKQGVKGALAAGAVVVPLVLFTGSQTRSPDTYIVAALAAGIGICATGGIGWMLWGNYMKTIIKFKGSLQGALTHMGELQEQIAELQKQQNKLEGKTTEIIKFSQDVLDQIPVLKETTGDNARLANLMTFLMERQQVLEQQFLDKMRDRLTTDEIEQFQDTEDTFTFSGENLKKINREKQALKAYNKAQRSGFFQRPYTKFSKIPQEWLTDNEFSDLI